MAKLNLSALFGLVSMAIVLPTAVCSPAWSSTPAVTISDSIECSSPGSAGSTYCVNLQGGIFTLGTNDPYNQGSALCDSGFTLSSGQQAGYNLCQFSAGQEAYFYCNSLNDYIDVTFGDSYAYVQTTSDDITYSWQTSPSPAYATRTPSDILTIQC